MNSRLPRIISEFPPLAKQWPEYIAHVLFDSPDPAEQLPESFLRGFLKSGYPRAKYTHTSNESDT